MTTDTREKAIFDDAVNGLERGDFSRLEPLFVGGVEGDGASRVVRWFELGWFEGERKALNEALSCAFFNGRTQVAEYLMERGVDPLAGDGTGMTGFHWAANRGQLETVKFLIRKRAAMEMKNMYGGTVLGCAVWSAVNEPKADHVAIIKALVEAGANLDEVGALTGNEAVDEVLMRGKRKRGG
jgi:hypothetical protein